jgi:hypothetical protein
LKTYLDNLRPFEKRVVVGGMVLFFIVLNYLFVWPHFSDWGALQFRKEQAEAKLQLFNNGIADIPRYTKLVQELEGEGLVVPPEEQAHNFSVAVQTQAAQSRVGIVSTAHISTSTNQFFINQSQSITILAGESALVDFLYNLGSGNSLIRVRDLSLGPDPTHMQLSGNVKLVASYQKKTPAKPATRSTQTAAR